MPRTIVPPAGPARPPDDGTVDVPLIGQIPAGVPLDAIDAGRPHREERGCRRTTPGGAAAGWLP